MTSTPSQPSPSHQQRLDQLANRLFTETVSLAGWTEYIYLSDDPREAAQDDQPFGRRITRRDADVWNTVAPLRAILRELISIARAQKIQVDEVVGRTNTSHWYSELTWSEEALDQFDALEEAYRIRLDNLPSSAVAGTPAYNSLIEERNAKAWYAVRKLSLYVSSIWLVNEHFERHMPRTKNGAAPPVPPPSPDTTRGPRR
ncbi:hypothetical protein ACFYXF_04035 [Streptomyces sp. NPDC002680]|uniref:hypothetical protein n=1 Tax=Streptomyces sp. NPDC002680 TaxID=3364659 RepID=UPI0036CEF57C